MRAHRLLWLSGIALCSLSPGHAAAQESAFGTQPAPSPQVPERPGAPAAEPITVDPLGVALRSMDMRRKVAQLMLVTMQGAFLPTSEDIAFLSLYTPGGVIIPQLPDPENASGYVSLVRQAEQRAGIPLLVGADLYQLGRGRSKLPSGFVQLPSLMAVAAAEDEDTTAKLAKLLAEYMAAMGFNLHMGPSLVLAPTLPEAQGTVHCLGSDPAFTSEAGNTILKAFSEQKVLAMPLGFPGGGGNRAGNSPAVLLTPKPLLRETDLLPYMRAIEQGAGILHVGNTLVPSLDTLGRPASLSKSVLHDLLREELRFQGVIVAGPLDSADIVTTYDPVEAAVMALENGADMLYWRGPDNRVMRVIDKVVWAVHEKQLSEARINQALSRILALKARQLPAPPEPEVSKKKSKKPKVLREGWRKRLLPKMKRSDKKLAKVQKKGPIADLAHAVERRSITVVQNRGQVLPLTEAKSMPILVTGVVGVEELHEAMTKHIKHISQQVIATAQRLGQIEDFEINRITSHIKGIRTVVCIFTDAVRPEGTTRLIRALKDSGVTVVAVLLGYPGNLPYLAEADGIVLAYTAGAAYAESLLAVADVLMGEGPVRIVAMEDDLELRAGEARVFDAREVIRVPAGRLPLTVSDQYPAGLSLAYDAASAIKKVVWDFGNRERRKEERTEYAYDRPGRYPIALTVTDAKGNTVSRTFHAVVR